MKMIFTVVLALYAGMTWATTITDHTIDSLLKVLDKTIENKAVYIEAKEKRIDSLMQIRARRNLSEQELYNVTQTLIWEYKSYVYDSARIYVKRNLELANRSGNAGWVDEMKIQFSHILLSGGLYKEAMDNLETINRAGLHGDVLKKYYYCLEQGYHHMAMYANDDFYAPEYERLSGAYIDSIRMLTDPNFNEYKRLAARSYIRDGNVDSAKVILKNMLKEYPFGSHDYAMITSTIASAYAVKPDGNQRKKYLILSALSDIMSAIRENESLRNLSELMYNEGDLELAYRYCAISMDDANVYNARLRRIEIAKTQPIIEKAYTSKIDQQHRTLKLYFTVISVMCFLLVVSLVMFWVQNRMIRRSKRELQELNRKLQELNDSLLESNRVKEGYIGHFLSMCSIYINKLERYRAMVFSKVTANKLDELKAMTRSTDVIDYEIKEFYRSFDKAFLKLYPDFVVRFNELLKPDERICPESEEVLTAELRIFALIRLGIHDSSQIAKFLRYSPNTVYTYRTKVKNKALDRNDLDSEIMKIGLC